MLSESLAGLGAKVLGIDASENSVEIATTHRNNMRPELIDSLEYNLTTIEDLKTEKSNFK